MRLTLRTLLAYLDDTLPPDQARAIGQKVADSPGAGELVDKIRRVTRRRGLSVPSTGDAGTPSDPNAVADYLSDSLPSDQIADFEQACLDSDVNLAEVAACHQILTLLLAEPVRVPPTARQRMYLLAKGPESLPNRRAGASVPVSGEMPEYEQPPADDRDAAFLLGMRAYSRADTPGRRAAMAGVVAALAAALAAAVWMASPAWVPPEAGPAVAVVAFPPAAKPADPPEEPKAKPADPDRVAPTPRPADAKPADAGVPAAKPAEPKPDAGIPVAPPRVDRMAIGKLETPDEILLARPIGGNWERVTAVMPDVAAADRLVAVPGYKAKVRLDNGVLVELWGHLPEQGQVPLPVLESVATLYSPGDGFDADFALHAGRVYLSARKPGGARLRVRVRDNVYDIVLADEKSLAVVEAVNALARGFTRDIDAATPAVTSATAATVHGAATISHAGGPPVKLPAGQFVTWTTVTPAPTAPRPASPMPGLKDSAYFNPFQLLASEADAKAVRQVLTGLATRAADRDGFKVACRELLGSDAGKLDRAKVLGQRLAVLGLAVTGDLSSVIDALNDEGKPYLREAAAFGLAGHLAATPADVEPFRERLKEKYSLADADTALAVRLVRGCTDTERKSSAALDQLGDCLSHPASVVRELAFWSLKTDIDPENRQSAALYTFDSAAPAAGRDAAVKAWKRRIEELKKKF